MQIARCAIPTEWLSGPGEPDRTAGQCLGCKDCRGVCLAVLEMLNAPRIRARGK